MQATVFASIQKGVARALLHPGLIALRWMMSLAVAWWLADPLVDLFEGLVARTAIPETMVVGIPYDVFSEFIAEFAKGGSLYERFAMVGVLLYWFIGQFLNGGIFAAVAQDAHFGPGRFWSACRQYFPAMLASSLVGFVLFLIFVAGTTTLWAHVVSTAIYDVRAPGSAFYSWWLGAFAILVLMGSAVWRIVDVMRLQLCTHQAQGGPLLLAVPGACLRASAFFVRYHFGTFAIFAAFIAAQVVVVFLSRFLFASQGVVLWWVIQATVIVRLLLGLGRICAMHCFMEGRLNQAGTATPKQEARDSDGPSAGERHDPYASVYEQPSVETNALAESEPEPFEPPAKAETVFAASWDDTRDEETPSALPWSDFQEPDPDPKPNSDINTDSDWKSADETENQRDKNPV